MAGVIYNFEMPEELYREIQCRADKLGINKLGFLKRCLKLGFLVDELENNEEARIVVQYLENGRVVKEKQLVFV